MAKNISEQIIQAIEKQDIIEIAKIYYRLSSYEVDKFKEECQQNDYNHLFDYLLIACEIHKEIEARKLDTNKANLLLADRLINPPSSVSDRELESIATLLDNLLFARLYGDCKNCLDPEVGAIYWRQRAGIFESLVSQLIKRKSFHDASMIAITHYLDTYDSADADTRAWSKVFLQDIFEIGFQRNWCPALMLTKDMYNQILEADIDRKQKKFLRFWAKESGLKV